MAQQGRRRGEIPRSTRRHQVHRVRPGRPAAAGRPRPHAPGPRLATQALVRKQCIFWWCVDPWGRQRNQSRNERRYQQVLAGIIRIAGGPPPSTASVASISQSFHRRWHSRVIGHGTTPRESTVKNQDLLAAFPISGNTSIVERSVGTRRTANRRPAAEGAAASRFVC
jgi:hypothetical protein